MKIGCHCEELCDEAISKARVKGTIMKIASPSARNDKERGLRMTDGESIFGIKERRKRR